MDEQRIYDLVEQHFIEWNRWLSGEINRPEFERRTKKIHEEIWSGWNEKNDAKTARN